MPGSRSRPAVVLLGTCGLLVLLGLPALLLLPACGGGAGHLTTSVESLDFGRVDHGAVPERRFQVKNEGLRTVVVASINSTCSCVRVEPGWRKTLGVGESTEVVVSLTSGAVPPQKLERKTVLITSDDPQVPLLHVPIHGEIEARLQLSPPVLYMGPGDAAGREAPRRLRLRPASGYEVVIERIEVLRHDWFEVKQEKVPEGIDLLLSVKPDPARRGPVDTFIRVHAVVTGRGLPPQKYDPQTHIKGTW